MSASQRNIRGPSLVDWRIGLHQLLPGLANQLREPADPYAEARRIGLPTPMYRFYESVAAFLDRAAEDTADLERQGVSWLYVGLRPPAGRPKYRELGLTPEQAVPYVTSLLPPSLRDGYQVQLAEYAVAAYSFVMIVNPDGGLHAEIVRGEMALLATGLASPEFRARSNPFTGRVEFDFEDVELRTLISRAFGAIPRDDTRFEAGSAFRWSYPPGYYECSIIRRGSSLRPVFFDFKAIAPGSPFCIHADPVS